MLAVGGGPVFHGELQDLWSVPLWPLPAQDTEMADKHVPVAAQGESLGPGASVL